MNFQQVRAVCEIVKTRFNMSAAAVALHRSQPALSRQITELERELGTAIFSRTRNKIVGLTSRGHDILAISQRLARDADALRQVAAGTTTTELRIATTHTHARYALPSVIKRYSERNPHVIFDLRQGNPAQCFQFVSQGEADLAIAVEVDRTPRDVVTLPIYKLARCVLAARGHPISRGKLTLERIAAYPIVGYSHPPNWKWLFGDTFAQAGLKPRITMSALDTDVSKTYVAMGIGIAVLASIAYDPVKDVDLVGKSVDHLFKPGILTLVLKKGAYLGRDTFRFLSEFCPHLGEEAIQKALDGLPVDRRELFERSPLVSRFPR